MAGTQLARWRASETMDEFVTRRQQEQARRDTDYAAGREKWSASTVTGRNLPAPRPSDVVALGARTLNAAARQPARSSAPVQTQRPVEPGGVRYGNLYAPPPDDLAELRRQQAEFARTTGEIDKQNSWMAIPALAPAAAILGLEGAAAVAARLAGPALRQAPLVLEEGMPYLRVGDNWATRAGRRAHAALKARVDAKPGWDGEQSIATEVGLRRPDVRVPARTPDPKVRYQMELKPNTPTGRQAAARAVKRYERETGNKTRAIFYSPKDFM